MVAPRFSWIGISALNLGINSLFLWRLGFPSRSVERNRSASAGYDDPHRHRHLGGIPLEYLCSFFWRRSLILGTNNPYHHHAPWSLARDASRFGSARRA